MQEGQKIAEMRAKGMQELVLDKLVEVLEADKAELKSMLNRVLMDNLTIHNNFSAERRSMFEAHEIETKKLRDKAAYYEGEHARVARSLQARANNDHVFSELVRSAKALSAMARGDGRRVRRGVMNDLAEQVNRVANAAIVSLEAQASR